MKSILTMAWTSEDPAAFDLAANIARKFGARLIGLEPPSYGVMSMAWADAGMGAPIASNANLIASVTVTERAASKAQSLLASKGAPDGMLRVFVVGGGCSGYQYGMAIAKQAEAGPVMKQICTLAATYEDQNGEPASGIDDLVSVGWSVPTAKYFTFDFDGTSATAAANRSGRIVRHAPTSRPPALRARGLTW